MSATNSTVVIPATPRGGDGQRFGRACHADQPCTSVRAGSVGGAHGELDSPQPSNMSTGHGPSSAAATIPAAR